VGEREASQARHPELVGAGARRDQARAGRELELQASGLQRRGQPGEAARPDVRELADDAASSRVVAPHQLPAQIRGDRLVTILDGIRDRLGLDIEPGLQREDRAGVSSVTRKRGQKVLQRAVAEAQAQADSQVLVLDRERAEVER